MTQQIIPQHKEFINAILTLMGKDSSTPAFLRWYLDTDKNGKPTKKPYATDWASRKDKNGKNQKDLSLLKSYEFMETHRADKLGIFIPGLTLLDFDYQAPIDYKQVDRDREQIKKLLNSCAIPWVLEPSAHGFHFLVPSSPDWVNSIPARLEAKIDGIGIEIHPQKATDGGGNYCALWFEKSIPSELLAFGVSELVTAGGDSARRIPANYAAFEAHLAPEIRAKLRGESYTPKKTLSKNPKTPKQQGEGARNNTLYSVGLSAIRKGQVPCDEQAITSFLLEYNAAYNAPPLDDTEVMIIASSVAKSNTAEAVGDKLEQFCSIPLANGFTNLGEFAEAHGLDLSLLQGEKEHDCWLKHKWGLSLLQRLIKTAFGLVYCSKDRNGGLLIWAARPAPSDTSKRTEFSCWEELLSAVYGDTKLWCTVFKIAGEWRKQLTAFFMPSEGAQSCQNQQPHTLTCDRVVLWVDGSGFHHAPVEAYPYPLCPRPTRLEWSIMAPIINEDNWTLEAVKARIEAFCPNYYDWFKRHCWGYPQEDENTAALLEAAANQVLCVNSPFYKGVHYLQGKKNDGKSTFWGSAFTDTLKLSGSLVPDNGFFPASVLNGYPGFINDDTYTQRPDGGVEGAINTRTIKVLGSGKAFISMKHKDSVEVRGALTMLSNYPPSYYLQDATVKERLIVVAVQNGLVRREGRIWDDRAKEFVDSAEVTAEEANKLVAIAIGWLVHGRIEQRKDFTRPKCKLEVEIDTEDHWRNFLHDCFLGTEEAGIKRQATAGGIMALYARYLHDEARVYNDQFESYRRGIQFSKTREAKLLAGCWFESLAPLTTGAPSTEEILLNSLQVTGGQALSRAFAELGLLYEESDRFYFMGKQVRARTVNLSARGAELARIPGVRRKLDETPDLLANLPDGEKERIGELQARINARVEANKAACLAECEQNKQQWEPEEEIPF